MLDAVSALITPAFSALTMGVGYWAAARTQRKSDERRTRSEQERLDTQNAHNERLAALAREHSLDDARHSIQLDTLFELQEMTRMLMRTSLLIVDADVTSIRESGHQKLLDDDLNYTNYENNISLSHRIARIVNDDLRSALEDLYRTCTSAAMHDYDESLDAHQQGLQLQKAMIDKNEIVNELLGKEIRSEISRRQHTESIDA